MTRGSTCKWAVVAVAVGMLCAPLLAADPPYYAKKATWQDTMLGAREALARHEADQSKTAEKPEDAAVTLGPWYMAGPFYVDNGAKRGFDHAFPPEQGVDLTKPMGQIRWTARPEFQDGAVQDLSAGTNGSTYLYRVITAAAPKTITGYFGSDDGLAAWLNGKKIISNDVPRGPGPNQDTAKLNLQKGDNHLLLKIHNNSGGHGYYFSTGAVAKESDPRLMAREQLWDLVGRDFPDGPQHRQMTWEKGDGLWATDWKAGDWTALADRYARAARLPRQAGKAKELAAQVKDAAGLQAVREVYYQSRDTEELLARGTTFNFRALYLAINDLIDTCGSEYPKGAEYLSRLDALQKSLEGIQEAAKGDASAKDKTLDITKDLLALQKEALLANPVLGFNELMFVKRSAKRLGLPQNWQGNSTIGGTGYENELVAISMKDPGGAARRLYKPEGSNFVGDVDLHWDADRMLFSMPGAGGRWQVFEMKVDGTGLRQVTPGTDKDVDNYDACYLPDGRILFCSTACYVGVPCVGGGDHVGSLYILDADGKGVRQLTFDQDHSWCPTVLNNGRVVYTRWEYSDIPHYFSRILFEMNPDGTAQFEHYGSNSYWPNSMFYTRPIPNHPTKIVTVVSGHHGVARMGELLILDPSRGKHEADGVVQRIPGYGKTVEPIIRDGLVDGSWPKFLHPYPLSEKHFLVSCQPDDKSPWGLYLVDVFDNMLLLREEPGYALFEPLPLAKTPTPPAIPDRVDLKRKDAVVYLVDVYKGGGLAGVPRGTVKRLRVYSNHYGYRGMGGHINIGIDGPWDVKRILGTVPVGEDGSAMFRVPANTPIVVEPLDAEGKAVQLMRSWYTAMPGEFASCVGCHEPQAQGPPARLAVATRRQPAEIEPWYGPARGFSFPREVQPVLDKYCVGCHDGGARPDGAKMPDFRGKDKRPDYRGGYSPSYEALHPYVRRPGPESDYHLLAAMEYHADTSELVQMLRKGHHGVTLDAEGWDRLVTWIDLNVPCHGTWSEHRAISGDGRVRRLALTKAYANVGDDPEAYPAAQAKPVAFVAPGPEKKPDVQTLQCAGWPFVATEAHERQAAGGPPARSIDLGAAGKLELVRIPAGEFVMGDPNGYPDEWPQSRVKIAKPFWMGKVEITNQQFAAFDPGHDSGYISVYNKDQSTRGETAGRPGQPVIRVTWQQAMAFCRWLSKKTGERVTLPTEAQWEYACRAGAATAMAYGAVDADFGKFANLADERVTALCRGDSPKWIPSIKAVNDGAVVTENVGKYTPNAWGLYDMHGNVFEWTLTTYKPYPYDVADGRDSGDLEGRKVVRGGSFYDRPKRARSAFRLGYPVWQKVYSVGFRVVMEDGKSSQLAAKPAP